MTSASWRQDADDAFAAAVRRVRTTAGLSQVELAARANLPVGAILDIERGTRIASHKETAILARVLDITN